MRHPRLVADPTAPAAPKNGVCLNGIYVAQNGTVGIKYNNSNLTGGLFVHAGSRCGNLRMAGPLPWQSTAKKIYRVGMTGGAPTSPAFLFLGARFVKPTC